MYGAADRQQAPGYHGEVRIGLVTWWFNRGQATVMRTIRHGLDLLGHETHVLARPTDPAFDRPSFVASDETWTTDGVTRASSHEISREEYLAWVEHSRVDAIITFQNTEFQALSAVRKLGVRTIGTYMWEGFSKADAAKAAGSFDRIFAMNGASQTQFESFGLPDVGLVRFASHPKLAAQRSPIRRDPGTRFIFMGGYLRHRKPLGAVTRAFTEGAPANATLTIKTQTPIRSAHLVIPTSRSDIALGRGDDLGDEVDLAQTDARLRVIMDDLGHDDFAAEILDHDVVVGVSRWEGLGLHSHEAEALGRGLLLNRMEPYIGHVADGGAALLCDSHVIGRRKQGVDVHEPDLDSLTEAFAQLSRPGAAAELASDIVRHDQRWQRFMSDVERLVD